MQREGIFRFVCAVFRVFIVFALLTSGVSAYVLSPAETEQRVHTIRYSIELGDRLIAIRELRDGQPAPAEVLPLLVDLLNDKHGKSAKEKRDKNLIRCLALEALARLPPNAVQSTSPLLVAIIGDADEDNKVAAQAAFTIARYRLAEEPALDAVAELSNMLRRSRNSSPLFEPATFALGTMGFAARDALGEFLQTLEGHGPDPGRYETTADAFVEVAMALKDRGDVLDSWELRQIIHRLERGLLALKRTGSSQSMQRAEIIAQTLQSLRAEMGHRHLLFRFGMAGNVDWVDGIIYCYIAWLLILCMCAARWPEVIVQIHGWLTKCELAGLWVFKFRTPIKCGPLLTFIVLTRFFIRRAKARRAPQRKSNPEIK